jgi:Undecaprenyl-phosphate glucose phosphotransferase
MDDSMTASETVLSKPQNFKIDTDIIAFFIAIGDALIIFCAGYASYLAGPFAKLETYPLPMYLTCMALYSVLIIFFLHYNELYKVESIVECRRSFPKIFSFCIFSLLILLALAFGLKISSAFSRIWALNWLISSVLGIWLVQLIARQCVLSMAKNGWFVRNVAIVGADTQGILLLEQLKKNRQPWVNIVGVFDDRSERISDSIDQNLILGDIETLLTMARKWRIDEILVALPWGADERVLEIMQKLQVLPADIRLCPESICYKLPVNGYADHYGIPILTAFNKPITGWDYVIKTIEDMILGVLILILISPLLLVIAILIKLDSPGPVFFRQKRYGFNNQLIEMYKFRTMYLENLDKNASRLTERNDPRVTRLGRFLRRTSLDELPQFINVVKGEMSIVGPRPHAMEAKAAGLLYEDIVDQYAARHKVKPGITGLAQVNGWRGNTDTEEKIQKRVDNDIEYINKWSLFLDLKIILKTIFVVIAGQNAY